MPQSSKAPATRAPCVVFGYHELGYACLQALLDMGAPVLALFTHRDDPGEERWWRSCAELASRHAIAVHTEEELDAQWIGRFRSWKPSIIYSFAYRRLLSQQVLDCALLGAFNVHPSKLPAYRGRAPVNWVLVNGERETGVTLHHMVARADAGDIVGQHTVAIDDRDTALTLYRKLVPLAADLIAEFHPLIVARRAPRRPQELSAGSYFGRRTPADGRIEWNWPARRIVNLVRAVTHPYPGAFCSAGGRQLFIWQASIAAEDGRFGQPGSVVCRSPSIPEAGETPAVTSKSRAVEIAAGAGVVRVGRVQFEGGAEGQADEVLAPLIEASVKLV